MAPSQTAPPGERACAILAFALVVPFSLTVLLDREIGLDEYLRLSSAFIGVSIAMVAGAFILFAGVSIWMAGRRSSWRESPAQAIVQSLRKRWSDDRFFSLAWPLLLFLLLLPSFNAFKQRILPRAGFRHDETLASLDRWLFGADPGPWLHGLIAGPFVTRFFDALYHSWFVPTTLGVCLVGLCAGTRLRGQYMLSYAGVWILLGAVAAWYLPAAGPAFYAALVEPSGAIPFQQVHDSLVATGGRERFLSSLGNQAYLLEGLGAPELTIGGGISAIPSVHNAIAVLFALMGFQIHRWVGIAAAGFAALIWVGSVYLNWHYAVDGILGAAGAIVIWIGSGWIIDRFASRAPVTGMKLQPA